MTTSRKLCKLTRMHREPHCRELLPCLLMPVKQAGSLPVFWWRSLGMKLTRHKQFRVGMCIVTYNHVLEFFLGSHSLKHLVMFACLSWTFVDCMHSFVSQTGSLSSLPHYTRVTHVLCAILLSNTWRNWPNVNVRSTSPPPLASFQGSHT